MTRPAARNLLAVIWLFLPVTLLAGPGENPRDWLEQMSSAMSQMSYQGTFVYMQGDEVVTMRITHVSDSAGVRERLVSVSGPSRELIRDSSGVRWVLGDDHSVLEDNAFKRSFFPDLPMDQKGRAEQSYTLKFGKTGRIAGQAVRNLKVLPRDNYRYGYSLWLEQHSGLLLKWELIDSNRKSLAKLMFTDIRMGSEVDPGELESSGELRKSKTVESHLPTGRGATKDTPRWLPGRVPPGFELTAHRISGPQDSKLFEHLVYSDGLAAVSIYVESAQNGHEADFGISRLGTTHAYSRDENGVLITVMGEVPAMTVEFIGRAVSANTD